MSMNNIVNKCKFIFPKNLVSYSDTELTLFAKILVEQYSNDLSIFYIICSANTFIQKGAI